MNLYADESVDRPEVERLRQDGLAVIYVAELSPSITDDEVLRQANDQGATQLTADKDFGELVFRKSRVPAAIVLLRLAGLPTAAKAEAVAEAVRDHAGELPGAFAVISPGQLRIRHAP